MEWEKAKNIVFIAFVVLNLGLGVLLLLEHRRYSMTPERDRNINIVLGQHNIGLYTTTMRRFPPMRPLDVSGFYYDPHELFDIFFPNQNEIERLEPYGYVFRHGNSELRISGPLVIFVYDTAWFGFDADHVPQITRTEAAVLTGEFINRHFPNFELDLTFERDGGIRLVYRQVFNSRLIYLNFVEFFVTDMGIEWIEMQFGQILGYSTAPRMIFAPDEALLTFAQQARDTDETIIILRMDMVYFQEYESLQPGTSYPAIPAYRIFVSGNEENTYLINAFTNQMIN